MYTSYKNAFYHKILLLYTALNLPSLIFVLYKSKVIRPVLNSPTFQFFYIILCVLLNKQSFEFALRSEGEKGKKYSGSIPRNACVTCET